MLFGYKCYGKLIGNNFAANLKPIQSFDNNKALKSISQLIYVN